MEKIIDYSMPIVNHIDSIINTCNQIKNIDKILFEKLADIIISKNNNNHMIYFLGIGKSGNISHHISDLLKSISISCSSLNIVNCTHGDIGTLKKDDLVILFSKSGNTEELINIIPLLRKKEVMILSVTNNSGSILSDISDYTFTLPNIKEISEGFDLVPTSSVVSQIIWGNILTSIIILKTNFSIDNYKINHFSGSIGKQLLLTSKDIMIPRDNIVIIINNYKLKNCILDICKKKCGSALITNNNNELIGIITDGDIRRNIDRLNENLTVNNIMMKDPICVLDNDNLYTIKMLFTNNKISCLPVVNLKKEIQGLINYDSFITL